MTTMIDPRVHSFIEKIDACFASAELIPGLAARHAAIFDSVPALKEQIALTLADNPVAAAQADAHLSAMFRRFRPRHQIARLPYSAQLDARYPFRDALQSAVEIVALGASPQSVGACEDPRLAAVLPFIDPNAGEDALAAANRAVLSCRVISACDLPDPREQALVGQWGAFAARRLRAGECLGVYGGRLMRPAEYFACVDDSFVLSAASGDQFCFIDGENSLAMANTRLAYDAQGLPVAQAETGYNIKPVRFHAVARDGRRFSIGAFFALHDMEEGVELRWNYGYSADLVAATFGSSHGGAASSSSTSASGVSRPISPSR